MKEKDKFKATVEDIAFGGDGIVKADGMVIFVPGTIPGELIIGEITKIKSDYCRGKLLEVVTASPQRIEPLCKYYSMCPGCCYGHMEYSTELEIKQNQLKFQLKNYITDTPEVLQEPYAMPDPYSYRNKIVLHEHKISTENFLGYSCGNADNVLDIEKCLIAKPQINEKLDALRHTNGFYHTLHEGMDLTLRYVSSNDEVVYFRNNPPKNASWLKEKMSFGSFSVPMGDFFQVNTQGCEMLLTECRSVIEQLRPSTFFDAYCGSGMFAALAGSCGVKQIHGVEISPSAIAAAQFNLKQFPEVQATFTAADSAKVLEEQLAAMPPDTLLLIDPPRGGLNAKTANIINRSPIRHLIYISCNPSTLSRDLRSLHTNNFKIQKARLIDMFPRSAHFEVFCYLSR